MLLYPLADEHEAEKNACEGDRKDLTAENESGEAGGQHDAQAGETHVLSSAMYQCFREKSIRWSSGADVLAERVKFVANGSGLALSVSSESDFELRYSQSIGKPYQ